MAESTWRFIQESKQMQAEKLARMLLKEKGIGNLSPSELGAQYNKICKEIYNAIKDFEIEK